MEYHEAIMYSIVTFFFLWLCLWIKSKVSDDKNTGIPYSKNPPPPPLRKSNYNTMSYSNSKNRVVALEALARAYDVVATAPNIDDTMLEIVKSIKAEVALINKER